MEELTPRELYAMAMARRTEEWDHTAALLAMIRNLLARTPVGPEVFHPYRQKPLSSLITEQSRHWPMMLKKFKALLKKE